MLKRLLSILVLGLAAGLALGVTPSQAQTPEQQELAQNAPVAVVAQVLGQAQVKHVDGDWRPVYWLDLLRPEDRIQTTGNGKVVCLFFFDNHLEIVDPASQGRLAFKNIQQVDGTIRKPATNNRPAAAIEIPYMLLRRLRVADFSLADDPEAYSKEEVFLSAWVKATTFPPVFYCKDMQLSKYRFQFFNEWDEFKYEGTSTEPRFKYPFRAPFQLTKNSLYYWQVLGPDDSIVVRKYPFRVLTQPLAQLVERHEKRFEAARQAGRATTIDSTDMFLLYNTQNLLDKNIHLLQDMVGQDPENPILYRAQVRAYLTRGCPAHARQALSRETALGSVDPVEK